jgi:hypothetical protein
MKSYAFDVMFSTMQSKMRSNERNYSFDIFS